MKRCPHCGSVGGDSDGYCQRDGAVLLRVEPLESYLPAARTTIEPGACIACGQGDADRGDGLCARCGQRLTGFATLVPLAAGATVGAWVVLSGRSRDDALVRGADDEVALLVLADVNALDAECAAIAALDADRAVAVPRVLERSVDARLGPYLVLGASLEASRVARDAPHPLSPTEALDCVASLLAAARAAELDGLQFALGVDDVSIDSSGRIRLARVRGSRRLAANESANPGGVLEVARALFVPDPALAIGPGLIRLLLAPPATIADAQTALTVERDAPQPPEPQSGFAVACDRGLHRERNDDAVECASGDVGGIAWHVLVVCDGVSSSRDSGTASRIAARTACEALAVFARAGELARERPGDAMIAAIRAAHEATCAHAFEPTAGDAPGTTLVAAFVRGGVATIGWVGDSRAYWLDSSTPRLLTTDHSWAQEAVARGEMTEAEAARQPLAHVITRCLGPLEVGDSHGLVAPDVREHALPGAGCLLLCTDGLWNYAPYASDLAAIVRDAKGGAATIARRLLGYALARGGRDNIGLAVCLIA